MLKIFLLLFLFFLNCKDQTPLLQAVKQGDIDKTKSLLASGYSANAKFENIPILHHAIETGNQNLVRTLLAYEAELNVVPTVRSSLLPTALQTAAKKHDWEMVKFLLENGQKIEEEPQIIGRFIYPSSLHYAAESGSTEMIEYLIEKGISLEYGKDQVQGSPLLWAYRAGKLNVVELLEKKGAEFPKEKLLSTFFFFIPNKPTIEKAISKLPKEDLLISKNYCRIRKNPVLFQYFLESKIPIPVQNNCDGFTLWELAIVDGDLETLSLLLESGISSEEVNSDGLSPYMVSCLAIEGDQKEIRKLLRSKGANLEYSLPKDYDFKVKLYKRQPIYSYHPQKEFIDNTARNKLYKAGTKAKEFCKD